ncbi:MAG: hypothetical protein JJ894_05935 [Dinoroseobacter sp.]|nr:hypothetical protein [Dinoroseobacter sp.]
MSEDHQRQTTEFLGMWIGGHSNDAEHIRADQVSALLKAHDIQEEFAPLVQRVLEVAAKAYWKETDRANIDYKACRKDLDKLISTTSKLLSVIDGAAPDTFRVLHEAGVAREFRNHSIGKIAEASAGIAWSSAATDAIELETSDASNLDHIRSQLAFLQSRAQSALTWSGAGKPGRPEDDSATGLMQFCFLVWTEIAKRDFTLAWHGNDADSDAARFCVDVARLVDYNLSASRIMNAARKVRETGIGINDLDKLVEDAEEFCKRIN